MKVNSVANLPDGIDDSVFATPRAKKGEHIDRAVDGPIDILVQDRSKLIGSAFAERAMKYARETPEAMLCHLLTPNCL